MRFIFPYVLLLSLMFMMFVKSKTKTHEQDVSEFFARESKANATRKKDINNLNYITIPFETLPFLSNPSEKIAGYEKDILSLKDKRILNLNGITNTELKLTYGAPNLPALSDYDENFSRMTVILGKWGDALYSENYIDEARKVLEFAIVSDCESSLIYVTLGKIYKEKNIDRLSFLIDKISHSNSPHKQAIIQKLNLL